jgi:hypothetical protein
VPLLTVTLELGGRSLDVLALVDSGADSTMLPYDSIEACGLPYHDVPGPVLTGVGAGGEFEFKNCEGRVTYGGAVVCKTFGVPAPRHDVPGLPFGLLGRRDFFSKHIVRFAWHRDPPEFNVDPVKRSKR